MPSILLVRRRCLSLVIASVLYVLAAGGFAPGQSAVAVAGARSDPPRAMATRKIEFTTDEGTWMSVDVSPDGRTIYFDHLGDIYSLPAEGGAARRLVGGSDWSVQPRVSPDGERLAFISDRSGSMNLWTLDLMTGDAAQLSPHAPGGQLFFADPEWTPEGDGVLVWATRRRNWFLGNLPREIRLYDARDGSKFRSLTGVGRASISGAESPSMSPHGKTLYYARFRETVSPFYGDRVLPEWQLEGRDIGSGRTFALPSAQATFALSSWHGGGFAPQLSRDGKKIVYGSRHGADTGLRLLNLETGEDRWLVFPVDRDQQESNFFYNLPNMGFSPDSEFLFAGFGGGLNRVRLDTGDVEPIPFTVDVKQEIAPPIRPKRRLPDDIGPPRRIRNPALSPDGRLIAFTAYDRVYVMDATGGTPRRIDPRSMQQSYPTWSPDGGAVAYVGYTAEGGGHVWRADLNGGDPKRLTRRAGNYVWPVFGRRGDTLYVSRIGGPHGEAARPPFDLVRLSLESGPDAAEEVGKANVVSATAQPARIHAHGDSDAQVTISVRHVLATLAADEPASMASVSAAGRPYNRRAQRLNELNAEDVAVSPDGAMIAAQIGHQIYVVPKSYLSPSHNGKLSLPEWGRGDEGGVRRVSRIGGEFPSWSADGNSLIYSLGDTIYRHDRTGDGSFSAEPTSEVRAPPLLDSEGAKGVFAVRNVRLLTMLGDRPIKNGVVVVEDGRIAAAGSARDIDVPKGAKIIDGAGGLLMPSFIDTHAHPDTASDGAGIRVGQPWPFLNYLAFGVTAIHDPAQAMGDLEYGDLIRAGRLIGPRIFGSGPHVTWQRGRLNSFDDASALVARYRDGWRTLSLKEYVTADRRGRRWIADAARQAGQLLPVFEGEDFNYNMTHLIDGYGDMSHSIGVAPLYDDVIQMIARSGMSVSYQFGTLRGEGAPSAMYRFMNEVDPLTDENAARFMPDERRRRRLARRLEIHPSEHAYPLMARQAASLQRAGVDVSIGDHGEWGGLGYHWEIWAAASGMSNYEALRMATILGARTLGMEADLGTIEPGKLADFVIIDGDPLKRIEDTLNVRVVATGGRVYKAPSLDQIWPQRKALSYDRWWEDAAPPVRPDTEAIRGADDELDWTTHSLIDDAGAAPRP